MRFVIEVLGPVLLTSVATAAGRYRDARRERAQDSYEEALRWRPQRLPEDAATGSRRAVPLTPGDGPAGRAVRRDDDAAGR